MHINKERRYARITTHDSDRGETLNYPYFIYSSLQKSKKLCPLPRSHKQNVNFNVLINLKNHTHFRKATMSGEITRLTPTSPPNLTT